jgi:transposase InsO family protein
VLQIAPSGYWRHAASERNPHLRCTRAKQDDGLAPHIERVWQANMRVYGADKVWKQMNREGIGVARCTVERLMKRMGIQGVRRGKVVRTTISDAKAPCPLDRVNRIFKAERPNQLWVSDFTYVSTWQGWLYVAFVIDVYARRIVGWRVSSSMHTDFVLDALEQALYARKHERDGALTHHSDRGSQYVSIRYSERLAEAGIEPSVGSKGLRQRPGRDNQRPVQGGGDSSPVLANTRVGGAGHPGMGILVQPAQAARTHRVYPAGRS